LDAALVLERKRSLIREQAEDVLEVHETTEGFENVAGLEHMRDWATRLATTGLLPKGALFVGPPGLGKSFIVKAVAHTLGLPLVSLRLVRSMWVGETERRLERALAVILAMAPAVVWIDEIDTVVPARSGGPSGDAGTSERVTGRLLECMGDFAANHGVLWIGTSNFVDRLDEALRSRLPAVFPFFHPTPAQVETLLPVLAQQVGRRLSPACDLKAVASKPQLALVSARELSNILTDAAQFTDEECGADAPIGASELEDAISARWRMAIPVEEEYLALVGLTRCDSAARLPWRTRSGNRPGVEVPAYLLPLLDDGVPNAARVEARLLELAIARDERRQLS
jgi:SpoVK/Ycf46/Vps4 family AAA+-type ATPase